MNWQRGLEAESGLEAELAYWKPFEAASVGLTMADYSRGCVIAFGAGQSDYADPAREARVARALSGAGAVILPTGAPTPEGAQRVLAERIGSYFAADPELAGLIVGVNTGFIRSACNARLATHRLDTEGLSPGEVAERAREIVFRVSVKADKSLGGPGRRYD